MLLLLCSFLLAFLVNESDGFGNRGGRDCFWTADWGGGGDGSLTESFGALIGTRVFGAKALDAILRFVLSSQTG